tara:strand:+ start:238 stop:705 length:468 start_codon:yes stop_codon:yes gene_type:complete
MSSDTEQELILSDDIKIVVTPINQNRDTPSNIDYKEQMVRKKEGKQMMWDDTKYNKQKRNGVFIFQKNRTKNQFGSIYVHIVEDVRPPKERLESWSINVGQQDRNVLFISSTFIAIDWDKWMELGGPKKVQGTQHIKKNKKNIIEYINQQKFKIT